MQTRSAVLTALLSCAGLAAQDSRTTSRPIERAAHEWYREAWKALEEDSGLFDDGYFELPEEWSEVEWPEGDEQDWTKGDYSAAVFVDPVRRSERALTYVAKAVTAGALRYPGTTLTRRAEAFRSDLSALTTAIALLRVRSIQRLERGVPQTASEDAATLLTLASQLDASEYGIAAFFAYSLETHVSTWVRHAESQLDERSVAAWRSRIERRLATRTTPFEHAQSDVTQVLAMFTDDRAFAKLPEPVRRQLQQRVAREAETAIAPLRTLDPSTLTSPLSEEVLEHLKEPLSALEARKKHALGELDYVLERLATLGADAEPDERSKELLETVLEQTAVLLALVVAPSTVNIAETSAKARIDLEKALEALQ